MFLEQVGTSSVRVELFRNSGRTTESKLLRGEILRTGQVLVPLEGQGQSAPTRTMDLAYKHHQRTITLVGVPEFSFGAYARHSFDRFGRNRDRPTSRSGSRPATY